MAKSVTTVDHEGHKSWPVPDAVWWSEEVQAIADGPTPTADAHFIVGQAYYVASRGVRGNRAKSIAHYQKAIALDPTHGPANLFYGRCLADGEGGLTADKVAALACYEIAVAAGLVDANRFAGDAYQNGWGCTQDDAKSILFYEAAAAAGHPGANFNLGVSKVYGNHGLKEDHVAAVHYLKAAAGSMGPANTVLGNFAMEGKGGMSKDPVKAAEYYTRALQMGGDGPNLKVLKILRAKANMLAQAQAAKDMESVANPECKKEVRAMLQTMYTHSNAGEDGKAATFEPQVRELARAEVDRLGGITLSRQVLQKTDEQYSLLVGIVQRDDKNVAPLNCAWIETASGLNAIEKSNATVVGATAKPVVAWEAGTVPAGGGGTDAFDASMLVGAAETGEIAKEMLQTVIDNENAKDEPSPSAETGMFLVRENETYGGRQDGYMIVYARKSKAAFKYLIMNPDSGNWFIGGNIISEGLPPFSSLETVVQNLQQKEHLFGRHNIQLTMPVPAMRGWSAKPPVHGSANQLKSSAFGAAAAAATGADGPLTMKDKKKAGKKEKKAKGGGVNAKKGVSKARMEGERVYLGYSMTQASHLLEPIRALMATLAIIFNLATSPKDLGFELPAGFHTDDFAASDNLSGEEVAKKTAMRTGPLKTRERCLAKLEEDYLYSDDHPLLPKARYIIDHIRFTFEFASPFAFASFYLFLCSRREFKIIRVKNKICDGTVVSEQQTVVLINAEYSSKEFGATQIFEIQLTFREFLTIKKALHKYYEIVRATGLRELLSKPIFKTKDNEQTQAPDLVALLAKLKEAADFGGFDEE